MIEHFYILTKGTNKLLGKISFYQLQLGVKAEIICQKHFQSARIEICLVGLRRILSKFEEPMLEKVNKVIQSSTDVTGSTKMKILASCTNIKTNKYKAAISVISKTKRNTYLPLIVSLGHKTEKNNLSPVL